MAQTFDLAWVLLGGIEDDLCDRAVVDLGDERYEPLQQAIDKELRIVAANMTISQIDTDWSTLGAIIYDRIEAAGALDPFSRVESFLIARSILNGLEMAIKIFIEELGFAKQEHDKTLPKSQNKIDPTRWLDRRVVRIVAHGQLPHILLR